MMNIGRSLVGISLGAMTSVLLLHNANALNGPSAIDIDGGPLGALELSGGVDGFGYVLNGTNSNGNLPDSNKSNGTNVGDALVELQKSSGILQFTLEIGAIGGTYALGMAPTKASVNVPVTGPLYVGYLTVAPPDLPFTISAGQLPSLEGWEGTPAWTNANKFTTDIWYVQNSTSRGVSLNYVKGPANITVTYGDGWDSGVFNFVQALATYSFNATNSLSLYYAGNLGTTGLNTYAYGQSTTQGYGAQFMNSQMFGGWYSFTKGNLSLVPEVQYVYAKAQSKLGIYKPTANLGAALFADYGFGTSPYSIGAWGEYFNSHTSSQNTASTQTWFIAPDAEGVGFSVSSTWQHKDLYVRADAGYLYLLHNKDANGVKFGYGGNGTGRGVFEGTLEAGLLF